LHRKKGAGYIRVEKKAKKRYRPRGTALEVPPKRYRPPLPSPPLPSTFTAMNEMEGKDGDRRRAEALRA
jgi:hypothetical protein